jgi:hypothetical protein
MGPIGQFRSEGFVRKEVKMLKKSLFAVAVVALLANGSGRGDQDPQLADHVCPAGTD